ncbi:MAG: porin family protein [Bacteroidaceae bacterium]|nr:porin family protein [Bacteroidaceae bacterium]
MRKFVYLLMVITFILLFVVPTQAQILKLGVKGGLNLSKLDTEISESNLKETSKGFFIGPMLEATVPVIGIGVDVAIMYSQRGTDKAKQQGIEVPLNLKYTIGAGSTLGVYFAAGPDFFFNLKDVEWGIGDVVVDRKKTEFGINLGAGLKLLRHLQLGVNYQIGLTKKNVITPGHLIELEDVDTGKTIMEQVNGKMEKARFNTWQMSLAYTF